MRICVVGTGYVGLVTGACFADVGNEVICVDIDEEKIKQLNNGDIPIFEDKLDNIVSKAMNQNNLSFSTNLKEAVEKSEIIFLAVSTPMNKDGSCKTDFILNAARDIGKFINEYKIVVVKSTVPVGTTEIIRRTIKNNIKQTNVNIRFDIANNPEFLKEGKAVDDFMYPDRVIVGLENKKNKSIFKKLYRPFSLNRDKLIFLDIASSELTKYAANAMLAMKISFINEISMLCERVGANINDVRNGIGSDKRIGYDFIYPSIGFGGSCFPKDVNSLKKQFEDLGLTSLISNATLDINEFQWKHFASRIINKFKDCDNKPIDIAVWGVTFKPGTDDIRESQAIKIIDRLLDNNFNITAYDPKGIINAKKYYKNKSNIKFSDDKYDALNKVEALILLTEWKEFRSPDLITMKETMACPIIFDGRNIYNQDELLSFNFKYYQIGVRSNNEE